MMVHLLKRTCHFLHAPVLFACAVLYRCRSILCEVSLAVFLLIFYCEYLHYNIVIQQCYWPTLSADKEDFSIPTTNENRVIVMVVADLHLKCTGASWNAIFNEEVQMRRCFQNAVHFLKPDLVFVLGDVLDKEVQHCNLEEFGKTIHRFDHIFSLPNETKMFVVAGNKDVGYHHQIDVDKNKEFMNAFNSSLIQLITVKKNYFVLLNSMTLGNDFCSLCSVVDHELSNIERKLKCSQEENRGKCDANMTMPVYSRPILIQHFPLYRTSDADCDDYDSAPLPRKLHNTAEYWECLSKNTTTRLLQKLSPRIVFSGHIHHGCTRRLPGDDGVEVTISSFNWRKKEKPAIGLAVVTTTNYEIVKCQMPRYSTIITIYLVGMMMIFVWIIYSYKTRRIFISK